MAHDLAPLTAIIVLAFLVRAVQVLRGGGLFADLGYDDGVYFGAAVGALHGLVPYRDFLFLHPPGIILVLSPFAWLASLTTPATGLAIARVAFMVLGTTNAVLVALIAGQRHGRRAAIFAGILYAVWHAAAGFERTTYLPGPENALLLLGLLTIEWRSRAGQREISSRRAILAGVFLGLAVTIQLWEVAPLAVIVGWQVVRSWHNGRGSWRVPVGLTAGAGVAFGAVCLPFLVAAGSQMVRYIVVDQLARPDLGLPFVARLRLLEGLPPGRLVPVGLVAVAGLAAAAVVSVGAWLQPSLRIWALLLTTQTAVLLTIQVFYPHYAAWIAPIGSIAIGSSAATIIGRLAKRATLARGARLAYAMAVAVLLLPNAVRVGHGLPVGTLNEDLAAARCVAADRPILLIETTALQRDLGAGCPIVFDTTGTSYESDRGQLAPGAVGPSRTHARGYQQAMVAYYSGSSAAMFDQLPADGLSSATLSTLRCHFATQLQLGQVTVLLSAGLAMGPSASCP